jgi:hypothetical protein
MERKVIKISPKKRQLVSIMIELRELIASGAIEHKF